MDFAALPPEINSARMYAGAGAGPLLTAAATWHGLAAELSSAAGDYGSIVSTVASGPWRGPASASMAAAAAPYVTWMGQAAAQASQTAVQAQVAATAYETAFAMTVPPPVIAANRALLASLVATNFLGQNTPAIAATEAHYAEMWAQDAAAMYGYAGSSAAASTVTPFTTPPTTTNGAGPAIQTAAVAQATGTATPTTALSQLTSGIPQTLQSMASPSASSSSGLSGILGLLTGGSSGNTALDNFWNTWGPNANIWNTIFSSGFYMPSNTMAPFLGLLGGAAAGEAAAGEALAPAAAAADSLGGTLAAPVGGLGGLGGLGGAVSAGLGQAGSIGALSVPPTWTAPIGAAASALPSAGLGATPNAATGGPASMLGGMPLAGAPGHGMNGAAPRYGFRPTVIAHPPAAG
ncbi:PPE family protein [Mycobacterium sp. MFM001]|uniref:PPE family protein n=1 Tax=Mycobacterium sp. MFM001 TaxID=2049453 RepID=UPI000DA45BDF|nr:PPE family protein [Mycobacterium sp. MFM001]GBE66513.1 PPE family protein [Mycobacterium sp. MFM001]